MRLDKNVSEIVLAFRKILDKTWPEIQEFNRKDDTGAMLGDWGQSCWERTVEKVLFQNGETRKDFILRGRRSYKKEKGSAAESR